MPGGARGRPTEQCCSSSPGAVGGISPLHVAFVAWVAAVIGFALGQRGSVIEVRRLSGAGSVTAARATSTRRACEVETSMVEGLNGDPVARASGPAIGKRAWAVTTASKSKHQSLSFLRLMPIPKSPRSPLQGRVLGYARRQSKCSATSARAPAARLCNLCSAACRAALPLPHPELLEKAVPALITAREALDRFHEMMRSKDKALLDPWIAMAAGTKRAAFAAGVEADKDAVAAVISTPWSSGQVEGKVDRLKAIKRLMYGRAKIDLLKSRIMALA